MASTIKLLYPASSANTVAFTFDVSSLASSTVWAGRASTAVDNTTNLDVDHLVGGVTKLGTGPTASKTVAIYVYSIVKIAAGVPTYVDGITGTDAAKTMTSANVALGCLKRLWSASTDATTGLVLAMPPTSIAARFGGILPPFYGLFMTHDSGVALDATAGSHSFHYERIQSQTV